jgi:hypothetical protein
MRKHTMLLAAALATLSAAPAAGQAWDTPSFFAPRPGEDIGLYVFQGTHDNARTGFGAIWRMEGNLSLGARGGFVSGGQGGSNHYMLGAEFYGPLGLVAPGSGLLVDWVLGLGADFNGVTVLRVPAGVSVGMNLGAGTGLQIKPYAHPRVAFELAAYDNAAGQEETETDFAFDVDLGADIGLGQSFVLRLGASLPVTDRTYRNDVIGAGIAYRWSRRLVVR